MTDKPAISEGRDRPVAALAALAPLRQARLELERLLEADGRSLARRLHLAEAASGRTSAEPPRSLAADPIFLAWSRLDAALSSALPNLSFARPEEGVRTPLATHVPAAQATTTRAVADPPAPRLSLQAALATVGAAEFRTRIRMKSTEASEAAPSKPVVRPAEPDNLTRIRGIPPTLAGALREEGVTSFTAIAAWTSADTRRIAAALGLGRRISRENWIEQAAILARGTGQATTPLKPTTTPSAPPVDVEANARMMQAIMLAETRASTVPAILDAEDGDAGEASPASALRAPVAQVPEADAELFDLAGETDIALMHAMIAAETVQVDAEPVEVPAAGDRPAEQGATAATTHEPARATLVMRAPVAHVAPPRQAIASPRLTAALAAPAARTARIETVAAAPSPFDDLMYIRGMTPLVAERLGRRGNQSVAGIARWTSDDVARMAVYLGPSARISRDQWIEQAAVLAAGQATAFARRRLAGDLTALATALPDTSVWVPAIKVSAAAPAAAPVTIAPTEQTDTAEPAPPIAAIPVAIAGEVAEPAAALAAAAVPLAAASVGESTPPPENRGGSDDAIDTPNASPTPNDTGDDHEFAALLISTNALQERLGQRLSRLQRDISGIRLEPGAATPEAEEERKRRREALANRLDRLAKTTSAPTTPLFEDAPLAKSRVPVRTPRDEGPAAPDRDLPAREGEADVRIVMREAKPDRQPPTRKADAAPPPTPRQAIHISPRRLIERLKRARDGRGTRGEPAPAAYRSVNEEASVEIVRLPDTRAGDRPADAAPATGTAPPAASGTKPANGVPRLFRSLDGNS